jgi:hypothetical protein
MMTFIRPRLRVPVRDALIGAVFAAAWLVRGGPTWWFSIMTVVTVGVRVITVYVRGGQDSDEGALAGSRADERQKLLSLRSRALAGNVSMIAAFAGLTIAIAVRAAWWWPFVVMLAVTGFAYLLGLSIYGVGEEGPADDASAGYEAHSSVS